MWDQKSQHGVTSTERTPAKQDEEVGARAGEGLAGVRKGNTGTAESLGALCQGEVAGEDTGCPGGLYLASSASPREGSTAPKHGVPHSHSWACVPQLLHFTGRGQAPCRKSLCEEPCQWTDLAGAPKSQCGPGSHLGVPVWANAEVAVGFGETLWWVCGDRISGEREEADSSGTSAVWRW